MKSQRKKQKVYIVLTYLGHEATIQSVYATLDGARKAADRLLSRGWGNKYTIHIIKKSVQGTEICSVFNEDEGAQSCVLPLTLIGTYRGN